MEPGDTIEGYTLNELFQTKLWYIQSWKGTDKEGVDVVSLNYDQRSLA